MTTRHACGIKRLWRALPMICLCLAGAEVRAALTCEQLLAVAQAAVRYRDQGYSLSQVLLGLKDVEAEHKLNKTEVDLLQKAVSASYLSQAAPEEVALECFRSGKLGKPADPK